VRALRIAFSDLHYTVDELVVGRDAVAVRTTLTGTHRGTFYGLAPTRRTLRVSQVTFDDFAEIAS
jgi:predicted ester cyclase